MKIITVIYLNSWTDKMSFSGQTNPVCKLKVWYKNVDSLCYLPKK